MIAPSGNNAVNRRLGDCPGDLMAKTPSHQRRPRFNPRSENWILHATNKRSPATTKNPTCHNSDTVQMKEQKSSIFIFFNRRLGKEIVGQSYHGVSHSNESEQAAAVFNDTDECHNIVLSEKVQA